MTKLHTDDESKDYILSLAREHGLPEAAARVGVNHVTLWEYVRKWEPSMVVERRPKVHFDNIPNEVCLAIYRDAVLKGIPQGDLATTHNLSIKNIRLAIKKGRDLHANPQRPTDSGSHRAA